MACCETGDGWGRGGERRVTWDVCFVTGPASENLRLRNLPSLSIEFPFLNAINDGAS